MWHDIEAEVDLLNFGLVANAAATLIRDAPRHQTEHGPPQAYAGVHSRRFRIKSTERPIIDSSVELGSGTGPGAARRTL